MTKKFHDVSAVPSSLPDSHLVPVINEVDHLTKGRYLAAQIELHCAFESEKRSFVSRLISQ